MRIGRPTWLVLTYVLLCGIVHADDDLPYMTTIAIERVPGDEAAFGEILFSTLHVNDPGKSALFLSRIDGLEIVATGASTVSIEYAGRPTIAGGDDDRFRQNTWVVDFEEPSVQELLQALRSSFGERPTVEELRRFVFEHIDQKSYSRGFDLASQVAATGEGDCTEHAVLLAALARANGYAARIALGSLLIDADTGLAAFGHAWAEIHDGQAWQIRDATMPDSDYSQGQLRYLPAGFLGDEGPGYNLALIDVVATMPVRISAVGNVP